MTELQPLEHCNVIVTVVDDGEFFAGDIFRRKFASPPPPVGHHVVAMIKDDNNSMSVAGYAHFRPFEEVMLVGGVCTDGRVMRQIPEEKSCLIAAAGGIYFNILRHAFARFANECDAYFGYCGDARAERVNLDAGFRKTGQQHLLVNFHKHLDDVAREALIDKISGIGPF
jgi:hypothetical protein